jgi:proprotein convertase subtilisin/kexin type 2
MSDRALCPPKMKVPRVVRSGNLHTRSSRLLALASLLTLLSACGGGGSGSANQPPPIHALPDQTGCFYQYTLPQSAQRAGIDPLLSSFWHLNNTGQDGGTRGEDLNVFPGWTSTRGNGTRIAIIDDALDVLHEDLAPNVVPGASYSYRSGSVGSAYPLPCLAADDHGTAVAGIAAARDQNAVGGAGVAPQAGLVGYSALATGFDADIADALMRGLADNGVYQNSWGSPDDGKLGEISSVISAAIETGITTGRNSKGAVYVFSNGNGGCYALDQNNRCLSERSTLDAYLNQRGVIVACGVDHDGRHPDYAEQGANLLVCGATGNASYTSLISTTAPKNRYRNDFSGTSASAPMVSGTAALLLSANPSLTWRDIRLILARSARRNDPGDGGWFANPSSGLAYNHKYGFGVANAAAALALASNWSSVGGSDTMRSCGPYLRTPNIALPDASGARVTPREDTIAVPAGCPISRIEYVEVSFTADHAYSGDLRIELTSPTGSTSELAVERLCDGSGDACGSYRNWQFGVTRHLDEPAVGEWRLRVTDAQQDDTGRWNNWSLRIWGR